MKTKKCIWRDGDGQHCEQNAGENSNYCEQHSPDKSPTRKGSEASWTGYSDKAQLSASYRWTKEKK